MSSTPFEEIWARIVEHAGETFYIKEGKHWFSWDNVPGNDNEKLIKLLRNKLDIDWVEYAKIRKFNDDRTIHIFKDENSAEIEIIDAENEKATLKISDGKTYDLKIKKNNGKPYIKESILIYKVKRNSFSHNRTNREISKNEFKKAYQMVPIEKPGVIRNKVQGYAYVWAVLHDQMISLGNW